MMMDQDRLPALFVSHGAPTLIQENVPARAFLEALGRQYRKVRAVLCISAHWNMPEARVNSLERPETIHDFYGFPEELYRIRYPARGSLVLAGRAMALLHHAGIGCGPDTARGLDHGAWVPLKLMYPEADIPVVQLSILQSLDPAVHYATGRALAGLRDEGVLILGSGGAVHPLGNPAASFGPGAPTDPWAVEFNDWLTDAVTRGDVDRLTGYRALAPHAEEAHPYPDHYMPLLVAMGAAGPGARGTVIHHSWDLGDLGMDAYAFR
jgi:4,5-DOPA dioxygenase extradiol